MSEFREVILQLGGNLSRTFTTVKEAQWYSGARVIVGSEVAPGNVLAILEAGLVERSRLWFDYRAWDTVTHFTTLRDDLVRARTKIVRIVTDRFHLQRATLVAEIILWGTGIEVIGIPHEDPEMRDRKDPVVRLVKDVLRAVWVRVTGHLVYDRDIRLARFEELLLSREAVRRIDPRLLHLLPTRYS